jgi:hypothetical protein
MRTTESKRKAGLVAKAAYEQSEASRLHSLRNTEAYKKYKADWQDIHNSMNNKSFRAIDWDKGKFSQ